MDSIAIGELRPLLFTVAYKMTKSAFFSDDIVQEVLLSYTERKPGGVQDVRRYLAKSVIYKCLDFLSKKKGSFYPGVDLPEPVTDTFLLSEIRHDISFGIVTLLGTLNPLERACFVLRECFDFEYNEIAEILERTEDNCRQLLHRAKTKVNSKRKATIPTGEVNKFETVFMHACQTGDMRALIDLMKADIVLYPDGGGKVKTVINPIYTKDFVVKYLISMREKYGHAFSYYPVHCNHQETMVITDKTTGAVDSVMIFERDGETVTSIYLIRNPDKLKGVKMEGVR